MKRKAAGAVLLCLAVIAILALLAVPAWAIIGGTQDSANTYQNVGMIVQMGAFVPDEWGFSASCTLVKNDPGNVAVLCAAHQLYGWAATDNVVTFAAVPDFGWVWTDSTGLGIGNVKTYPVIAQMLHPGYAPTGGFTWSVEDVALMWLGEQVHLPDGTLMPTRPIIGLHGLDAVDLRSESFTAVGYGLTGWLQGSNIALFHGGVGVVTWNGRNYGEVSVKSDRWAFADRYLQLSECQGDNDSGSPLLLDGTIVAVCSCGSPRQASGTYDYRLDTQSAQDFVNYWLDHGPPL